MTAWTIKGILQRCTRPQPQKGTIGPRDLVNYCLRMRLLSRSRDGTYRTTDLGYGVLQAYDR